MMAPIKSRFTVFEAACDTCGRQFLFRREGEYMAMRWGTHIWCYNCIPFCACGDRLGDHEDKGCTECACEGFTPEG